MAVTSCATTAPPALRLRDTSHLSSFSPVPSGADMPLPPWGHHCDRAFLPGGPMLGPDPLPHPLLAPSGGRWRQLGRGRLYCEDSQLCPSRAG